MGARTRIRGSALAVAASLALTLPGCSHVHERRSTSPIVSGDEGEGDDTRVEERRGKRYGTWKPYVAALVLGAVVGASAMIWTGFLTPNRPLAVAGIVLVATAPVAGSVAFLVKQDTPWTRTKWESWQPAGPIDARLVPDRVVVHVVTPSLTPPTLHVELGDSLRRTPLSLVGPTEDHFDVE